MIKKALFLDRDGVINVRIEQDYVRNWSEFVFLPRTAEAIKRLNVHFDYCFVVTNQQGIAKKLMLESDLLDIHQKMCNSLSKESARIDAVYYCKDHQKDNPSCRKPNTGMAEQAAIDFSDFDFAQSVMVGDSLSDMEFGKRMGMKTIFINGKPEYSADELAKFNNIIDLRFDSLIQYALSIS